MSKKKSKQPKGKKARKDKPKKKFQGKAKKKAKNASKKPYTLVSDGVNVGSVWKNTTAETVTFPVTREKFADISSVGAAYQLLATQYLNPGNTVLFPVFSGIARNYEQYKVKHLKFYFRTMEYMASGSAVSAGIVAMATNFDPDADHFTSISELENYTHSISGPPYSGVIIHDVVEETRKRNKNSGLLPLKNYYVNYAPNQAAPSFPVANGAKFFDIGEFQVACNGTQAGVMGELWVEYSFEMIRRIQPSGAPLGSFVHFSSITVNSGDWCLGMTEQQGGSLPGVVIGTNSITMPGQIAGKYMLVYHGRSTVGGGFGTTTITNGTGMTAQAFLSDYNARNINSTAVSATSGTGTDCVIVKFARLSNNGGVWNIANVGITGASGADIFILSIPERAVQAVEPLSEVDSSLLLKNEELERRLRRLEGLLSAPCLDESKEEEHGIVPDMETSVHIPRSLLQKMLLGGQS